MRNIEILKINERASAMSGCIRFDKGSAKFPFPDEFLPLIEEVKKDIAGTYFGYPMIGGEKLLKEQIAGFERKNGRDVSADDVVVTHGGMSGIFTFLGVVTKPGDEIVTNEYYFEGFSLAIGYFQLTHRKVALADQDTLRKTITKKTRVIILNSPENPTGKVYTKDEIGQIVRLAQGKNILVLSDEVTNRIIYGGVQCAGPSLDNGNVVAVNSFSKNWFIPGIRVGWSISKNPEVNERMSNFLAIQSAGVNLFGQLLMGKILEKLDEDEFLSPRIAVLSQRRDAMKNALDQEGIHYLHDVQGGMNFYVDLQKSDNEIADRLLQEHAVALVPGGLFEGRPSRYARLGFGAVGEEEIVRGIKIIAGTL